MVFHGRRGKYFRILFLIQVSCFVNFCISIHHFLFQFLNVFIENLAQVFLLEHLFLLRQHYFVVLIDFSQAVPVHLSIEADGGEEPLHDEAIGFGVILLFVGFGFVFVFEEFVAKFFVVFIGDGAFFEIIHVECGDKK